MTLQISRGGNFQENTVSLDVGFDGEKGKNVTRSMYLVRIENEDSGSMLSRDVPVSNLGFLQPQATHNTPCMFVCLSSNTCYKITNGANISLCERVWEN